MDDNLQNLHSLDIQQRNPYALTTTAKPSGLIKNMVNFFNNSLVLANSQISETLQKARKRGSPSYDIQRTSVTEDTQIAQQEATYIDRFSYLTFDTLRLMAEKNPIVTAIISRRKSQMGCFCRPNHKVNTMGYEVITKRGVEPSSKDEGFRYWLEDYILHTGFTQGRKKSDQMNFEDFVKREVDDLLTVDQIAIEKMPANDGSLYCFLPVDAGTIRYARNWDRVPINLNDARMPTLEIHKEDERIEALKERMKGVPEALIKYVQVFDHKRVDYYTEEDLIFRVFTPGNNIRLNNYGLGCLEKLVATVTSHLNAETVTRMAFSNGWTTRGILNIKGNVTQEVLTSFKRQWYNQLAGAANSWRTPVIGGEDTDVQWVPMNNNNQDMGWENWLSYCVKIICACYLIAPQEIGWDSNVGLVSAAGDSGKKNMVLLTESKDVGLTPILRFFENLINEEIFPLIYLPNSDILASDRYLFRFKGYGSDGPDQVADRLIRELNSYKKLDEVRVEQGLDPIGGLIGEMVGNPNLIPFYTAMYFPPEGQNGEASAQAKNRSTQKEREQRSARKKQRSR